MSKASWLVVVDPCGSVMWAEGGVPERWTHATAAELATAAPELGEAARAAAEEVRRGAPRARRVVSTKAADVEVVALPAVPLVRRPCNLRALVDRALAPFRAQAESRDVLLRVDDEMGELFSVDVDAPKVTWVVATLVGNALRFARAGSRHLAGGTITVALRRNADHATIEVKDDGPGIERDRLAWLLDPGVMAPGAAIALAMARDVVVAHGGTLVVESSTDPDAHGTTVRVELPL